MMLAKEVKPFIWHGNTTWLEKKARKFVNFMDKIRVKNLCMIFTISSAKGSSLRKCVLQGDLCGKRKSQHGNCKAHFDNFRLLPFFVKQHFAV